VGHPAVHQELRGVGPGRIDGALIELLISFAPLEFDGERELRRTLVSACPIAALHWQFEYHCPGLDCKAPLWRPARAGSRHLYRREPRCRVVGVAQGALSAYGQGARHRLTGPPGAGKSTLVDQLAKHYRKENQTVGIIAVDPTSPYTGGAILGDRIRMQDHYSDPGIYIRSMATRGSLGGLARATADAATVLDASGRDLVMIETVGVGQDEVDIVRLADVTIVILVPGMGDDVQTIKAGIMEIADIFVINKSDREGRNGWSARFAPCNRWPRGTTAGLLRL
jgi:Ni2+-binding GTPase involved in maturation of urease and hydrogenase